jgi:Transposase zinc-binding domain
LRSIAKVSGVHLRLVFQYLEHHLLAAAAKFQPNARAQYVRHRPEQTALYQLNQQHAATFFAQAQDATGSSLPLYVKDEFDSFLSCGILVHGFLRLHCGGCKQDQLLTFSCKRRGFCHSCGAKRMSETAAYLVDHVIPSVQVRQRQVIKKILNYLGLDPQPPPRAPARGQMAF